jgi:hypothetical protein
MTLHEIRQCEALVLAVDEVTRAIGRELLHLLAGTQQACPLDWPVLIVQGPGDALRCVHRAEPGVLIVCASPVRIDDVSALIDALRQRRPQLAQLAVAAAHDELVERAVRAAGASHYFALDSESERGLLRGTLGALGVLSDTSQASPASHSSQASPASHPSHPSHASHSGLSPPRAARSPRTRARGYEGIRR